MEISAKIGLAPRASVPLWVGLDLCAVAYPGLRRWRGEPVIWQEHCQKLHENERNWTERGRDLISSTPHRRVWALRVNYPLTLIFQI